MYLLPDDARGLLRIVQLRLESWHVRIQKHGDQRRSRNHLAKEPKPLPLHRSEKHDHPGCVPARSVEAGGETLFDGVAAAVEDNRDR